MGGTTWICLPPVHDLATLSSALTACDSSELLLEPLILRFASCRKRQLVPTLMNGLEPRVHGQHHVDLSSARA